MLRGRERREEGIKGEGRERKEERGGVGREGGRVEVGERKGRGQRGRGEGEGLVCDWCSLTGEWWNRRN